MPGPKSQVKFTFSHPTFLEFFTSLHVTTLSLNEQLAFITVSQFYNKQNYHLEQGALYCKMFVQLYYGLVGDKFHDNIPDAAPFLKQMFLKSSIIEKGAYVIHNWV